MKSDRPTVLSRIASVSFLALGLPDGALGVAWPSLRRTFGLPLSGLGALLAAAMAGTLVSSFWSGALVARAGAGRVLAWGSAALAAGALGFAAAPGWWGVLGSAMVAGLGIGAVDAALNAFAAARLSPRRVAWLHACYGVGAALGPLEMSAALAWTGSWRWGYAALAGVPALLALTFWGSRDRWQVDATEVHPASRVGDALRRPAVWAGMVLFFVYTGLEAAAGQWAYSLLAEGRGIDPGLAGALVSLYWGSLTLGRIGFGAAAAKLAPAKILSFGGSLAVLAAAVLALGRGAGSAAAGLAALGFALAPVYPLLMAGTPARLGPAFAAQAIGFQVMAGYLGAAAIPGAAGLLARGHGLEALGPFLLGLSLALVLAERMLLAGWFRTRSQGSHAGRASAAHSG
jgi:fucose permease